MIEGSVDLVSLHNAAGWVGDRERDGKLEVAAYLHDEVIGEATAALYRPDLEQVGFGDGRCGFEIEFSRTIEQRDLPFVTIRVNGSNLAIARTYRESYIDFVRAVTAIYPAAGRQRSIFGGLWTDRTDALDMLNGRRSIGLCSAKTYPKVRSFIADGLVEVAARQATVGDGEYKAEHALAATSAVDKARTYVTEELADLLRAICDDVPVLYAIQEIRSTEGSFYQACSVEHLSSPGELVLIYNVSAPGARIDFVNDSHELPEFGPGNLSRWTKEGLAVVPVVVAGTERAVKSTDFNIGGSVVVGPGVVHRIAVPEGVTVTRLVIAPKRVTPVRFLSGLLSWSDSDLGCGVRARM